PSRAFTWPICISRLTRRRGNSYLFDMPLLKLDTTVVLSDDKRKALFASLSKIMAETIGKPEQYVMVTIGSAAILMSGKPGDAAWGDGRSIGGGGRGGASVPPHPEGT